MKTTTIITIILLILAAALVLFFFFRRVAPPIATPTISPTPVDQETASVNVYFINMNLNTTPEDCSVIFAVAREVSTPQAPARPTVESLLEGPTAEETSMGYTTSINPGVQLNSISIEDSVAYADFDARLNEGAAGSCLVTAIRAQISETLMQFPTVDEVVISVDGEVEEILQP